jgi:hypothetical protein
MKLPKHGRFLSVTAAALASLSTGATAFNIDESVEGFWYESGLNASRGWALQYLPTGPEQGVVFVAGYVYDADGNAVWLVGQSDSVFDGEHEVDIPLLAFQGGLFGPGVGAPSFESAGNLNVVFDTCNSAEFTFTGTIAPDFTQSFDAFLDIVNEDGAGYDRCVYQQPFAGCPAFAQDLGNRACGIGGTINEDITLTNDTTWVLTSALFVGERADIGDPVPAAGPTLTIEPGTRIVGTKSGRTALVISRGSRLIAEGLPHAPIVMTGENYAATGAAAGDWGGLVINGAAPLNTCDASPCEAVGEGDSGAYGGDDPNDNSGVLKYVRVQFAGDKVTDEDELNGIAFQGVGSGTVVDYVQVHRNADDGVEFFGGTVNAKHLILTDIEDDSVDWTQGWQGKLQYVLVKQIQDATVDTDRGMELDNLEQNNDAEPRSGGVMANFTLVGKPGELGINPRRGTGGNFSNFIVTGFQNCLDIDSAATFNAAGGPGARTGVLTFNNTILDCATNIVENDEDTPDPWSVQDFFDEQDGNSEQDPMLDGVFPPEDADYLSGYELDPAIYGDFFEHVDYIGAFRSQATAWHYNWSEFVDN